MSAIVGVYRLDGERVEESGIRHMVEAMPHRCPDGVGVWVEGSVGLGHGMLHTTPESLHEALPISSSNQRFALTADARVDNREELLSRLNVTSAAPDSTLLMEAYGAWGEACFEALVGDFAFGLWDHQERRLLCVRDHFGVKPFYYVHQPGKLFAFATEIKALLTLPELVPSLNEARVADYLAGVNDDAESTIYKGVYKLPAAHCAEVSSKGLRIERYYKLAPANLDPMQEEAYAERLRDLFGEAVRTRLRSIFRVGSQLSGGMDSSAVTCVARDFIQETGGQQLDTFSLIFDEVDSADERTYIQAVIDQGGVTAHKIDGDDLGPLRNLTEVYAGLDDHLVGGTQHLVWALMKKAQQVGVRVVLDGVDGDTVIDHGELLLSELAQEGAWPRLSHEVHAAAERFRSTQQRHNFEEELASPNVTLHRYVLPEVQAQAEGGRWVDFLGSVRGLSLHVGVSPFYLLRRYGRKLLLPPAVRRWRRRRRGTNVSMPPHINPALAERTGLAARIGRRHRSTEAASRRVREHQREMLESAHLSTALEVTNHFAALHGLEVRHPFMDRRLVEFCLALPSGQSLHDGWTRYILRRALQHTLPGLVAWRVGKADMGGAMERGLLVVDREFLAEEMDHIERLQPYLDTGYIRGLWDRRNALSGPELGELTQAVTLSRWLRSNFSQDVASAGSRMKSPHTSNVRRMGGASISA